MKRIAAIEENLEAIQPKLDLGSSDWTKTEKEHIEKCYYEITKVSVGRGRTVDLGCQECVQSAVNIINNYQALVLQEEAGEKAPKAKVVKLVSNATADWRETGKTIEAEAARLAFTFAKKDRTKNQRIAALEAHIAANPVQEETTTDESLDLLGDDEYTPEQLVEIIKANTGEELDPTAHTVEELLAKVKEFEDEDTDDEENAGE